MSNSIAIVLGASGSVGQALVACLAGSAAFDRIVVVTRRPLEDAHNAKVDQVVVNPMTPDALAQRVADVARQHKAIGFSVLGVGAGTAKMSIDEHRAIDVELNAAFARGLKASGQVDHLVFMSAVGANKAASTEGSGAAGMPRYARVKGEAEAAVQALGPRVVSVVRPSVIIGSQHTPALLAGLMALASPVLPNRLRPIRASDLAQAMVALARQAPAATAIYEYADLKTLARLD